MNGVSAVVPNRDGGKLLERCLDALQASPSVTEVIVVDDGSTDESPRRAGERGGVQVLRSPGRGFAAAVNSGVAAARGELVLILNSDAFVRSDTVERLAATLAERPRLALCAAGLVREDGARAKSHDRLLTLGCALRESLALHSTWVVETPGVQPARYIPLACVLARRAAWDEVGGLDERYQFYFEDHDLCWRLADAGWEIAVRWDAEAIHVEGGSSQAKEAPQQWFRQYHESRIRYLRKRYPHSWPVYMVLWIPNALAHAGLWHARAAVSRARGDREGAASGRAWAAAYIRAAGLDLD